MPPHRSPESQPNPAGKVNQHFRRFAESEIAAPARHVRSQLLHRRFHADALGPSRDLPDSPLESIQSLRRICCGRYLQSPDDTERRPVQLIDNQAADGVQWQVLAGRSDSFQLQSVHTGKSLCGPDNDNNGGAVIQRQNTAPQNGGSLEWWPKAIETVHQLNPLPWF